MVAMANLDIPSQFLRRYIASALNVVIQVSRLADGTRKLVSLQEITGMEGEVITMQEIFSFQQTGLRPDGKIAGRFMFNGIRPKFMELFKIHDLDMPSASFEKAVVLEV
jgi:pilus assembly protein CpaF